MAHIGSWGLPEFGITEKIQSVFTPNRAYAASGGSNLYGSTPMATSSGGQNYTPANMSYNPNAGAQQTGGVQRAGSTGQTMGATDTGQNNYNVPGPQGQPDINELYGPVMDAINRLEAEYKQGWGPMESQIKSEYGAMVPQIEQRKSEEQTKLAQGQREAESGATGEIAKARRLYQELRQGELARLSSMGLSSSSAAEGSLEMLGRDISQQIGGAQSALTETVTKIREEGQRIESWFNNKKTELEQQSQAAIEQARIKFNETLANLQQMRVGTEQNKASDRLQAMYQYRDEVARVQEFNANMNFALEQWRTQKAQALQQAQQQQARFDPYNFQTGEVQGAMGGLPLSQINISGKGAPTYRYGGQATGEDEFTQWLNQQNQQGG